MTILSIDFQQILFILYLLFIFSAACQLLYTWGIFSRLAFYQGKSAQGARVPVSVVICAKNEYYNLQRNLPLILGQDYPTFEVVVVNDASEDDTYYLLQSLSEEYSHLSVVNIQQDLNFFSGKKFPLALGIRSAKHDLVILTDADCRPLSNRWISEMQAGFSGGRQIVLGYSKYERRPGLTNKLIRFDTLQIAMRYLSFALAGQPYMGVGRNLAYRKSVFMAAGGFISHYRIKSGDDDLFINRIADHKNTGIVISQESQTISLPKTTFRDWSRQKRRHLSTGIYYKLRHKFMLSIYPLTLFLFYATVITLASFMYNILVITSLFVVRQVSYLVVVKKSMNRLKEKKLLLISPILELFILFLNPVLAISNLIHKDNKWK